MVDQTKVEREIERLYGQKSPAYQFLHWRESWFHMKFPDESDTRHARLKKVEGEFFQAEKFIF